MLWTDIIDPADLTGYARESLADYERTQGSLAVFLPNREVADIVVRFVKGQTGLIDVAKFRAYDAEPEIGKRKSGSRVTLELPAVGQNIPVTEYEQLRARGGNPSDVEIRNAILNTTDTVIRAVADAVERMRGIVLVTGKATIAELGTDDDFGRDAGHTVTAAASWATTTTDIIGHIQTWVDAYVTANGREPGAMLVSRRIARFIAKNDQFKTALIGGASRPATLQDVNDTITAEGLPPLVSYNRQVSVDGVTTKVIADDKAILLPAPVESDDWMGTELGATFWGRTLTSMDPDYNLVSDEQPGVVAGVYRNPKPPKGAEVISDGISMPVLANANLSFVADVVP